MRIALLCSLLIAPLLACAGSEEAPSEPVSTRVESVDLGIALASTVGFEVATNEGGQLELLTSDDRPQGRFWMTLGETQDGGINLVEVVNAQKAVYEGMPEGAFSGNRELMMADGRPGYYSRGQFDENGYRVEEIRVTALHPSENRVLQAHYRYPFADDSSERLNDLLVLVGELEALDPSTGG